ncbi:hypothetical protein Bca52824_015351 [Brassica carinata]|uniref:Uncharacterized protein n=1 Tax=Brassica carinata TaxID=52824 RepID=A0A8X7W4U8_BRACI|nr:hypothetical protein Bca52824_015351 [Brassica carinata]
MCVINGFGHAPPEHASIKPLSHTYSNDKIHSMVVPLFHSMELPWNRFLLHPPLRLCWPLGVESGLLPSLLTICVCSQDTEEVLDVFIHDQTPPKGRASLLPSVSKKLPFYTHRLQGCLSP